MLDPIQAKIDRAQNDYRAAMRAGDLEKQAALASWIERLRASQTRRRAVIAASERAYSIASTLVSRYA